MQCNVIPLGTRVKLGGRVQGAHGNLKMPTSIVHAGRKIGRLRQCSLARHMALPGDHPGPHHQQCHAYGGQQLNPDFVFCLVHLVEVAVEHPTP